jgi:hypothetical protein
MASFAELVGTALSAATGRLAEGSRRNAREALEARYELARQGREAMTGLGVRPATTATAPPRQRRSA